MAHLVGHTRVQQPHGGGRRLLGAPSGHRLHEPRAHGDRPHTRTAAAAARLPVRATTCGGVVVQVRVVHVVVVVVIEIRLGLGLGVGVGLGLRIHMPEVEKRRLKSSYFSTFRLSARRRE